MSHTPGPWEYQNWGGHLFISADHARMTVCDLRGWGYLTGSGALALPPETAAAIQDANGRLIAAAPLLKETNYVLAMLALQSDRYQSDPDYRDAVDDALGADAIANPERLS